MSTAGFAAHRGEARVGMFKALARHIRCMLESYAISTMLPALPICILGAGAGAGCGVGDVAGELWDLAPKPVAESRSITALNRSRTALDEFPVLVSIPALGVGQTGPDRSGVRLGEEER